MRLLDWQVGLIGRLKPADLMHFGVTARKTVQPDCKSSILRTDNVISRLDLSRMNKAYCGEFKTSVANLNVTLFYSRDGCIASCAWQLLVADDLNILICIHGIAHGYHQLDTFAFKNAFASTLAYSSSVNECQSTKQVNVIISNGSYMCYMHDNLSKIQT